MAKRRPTNSEIAARLEQLGELLRAEGVNRFKVKAYRTAADAVRSQPADLAKLIASGKPLPKVPGIGTSIAGAIREIVQSGTLGTIDQLSAGLPPGTAEIAAKAGVSIKEAKRLAQKLSISSPEELAKTLETGEAGALVGPAREFRLRAALAGVRRLLWEDASELARGFADGVAALASVRRVEVTGDVRRGVETVGVLSLLVEASRPAGVRRWLTAHGGVERVERLDSGSIELKLAAGPMLRVRFGEADAWGSALVEETGSAKHLEDVATLAPSKRRPPAATEEAWYEQRGLPLIPLELREGRGEVELAMKGRLPHLLTQGDIRGDLHMHTTASDGAQSAEQMAFAARELGYEYIAITDHSKSLRITNGLDEKRLQRQAQEIDALNRTRPGIRILKGSEVDILESGSLDFGDATLAKLDIVVASIHSRFNLPKKAQTDRLIRAIENPYVTCVGHLTGRKLLRRPGYELDIPRVLKAVKKNSKLIEINSSPDRLDISDEVALQARDLRIPILINTDAHHVRELGFMRHGIRQGRRGWQTRDTVVNTLPIRALLALLRAMRAGAAEPIP